MEKGNESRGGAERRMAGRDRDEAQCQAALLIETPDREKIRGWMPASLNKVKPRSGRGCKARGES